MIKNLLFGAYILTQNLIIKNNNKNNKNKSYAFKTSINYKVATATVYRETTETIVASRNWTKNKKRDLFVKMPLSQIWVTNVKICVPRYKATTIQDKEKFKSMFKWSSFIFVAKKKGYCCHQSCSNQAALLNEKCFYKK